MTPQYIQVDWVPVEIIQRAFNEGRFLERVAEGELTVRIMDYDTHLSKKQRKKMNHDARTTATVTKCTRSQMLLFRDKSNMSIALAHRYIRRDGTLGGSGKVNPHWIVVGNRLLKRRLSP